MVDPCQPAPTLVRRGPDGPTDRYGAPLAAIEDLTTLSPFLMSVVSNSDLWMYVSSAQGLTCGREHAERCLFPYETDDRLHEAGGRVGPYTALRAHDDGGRACVWRPFLEERPPGARRLYKSFLGDRVIFEETHDALGLTFRYQWANCAPYGFVRTSELTAHGGPRAVEVLDGLRAVMPSGVALPTQQRASALVNAYRRSERVTPRVATFALSAMIVDRAEPAEALRANVVWSAGLDGARVLLDPRNISAFTHKEPLVETDELRGRPGAYLLDASVEVTPDAPVAWEIVADVDLSQADVVRLLGALEQDGLREEIHRQVNLASDALFARLCAADGEQRTGRSVQDAHHLANVLFNCMRGGVFVDGQRAPKDDLRAFVTERNAAVAERHAGLFDELEDPVDCVRLVEAARATGDADLTRLALEYLPITFSRRHGDPSRPWNAFAIRLRHPDGRPNLYYQGNWRDIFQNWEALTLSYPGFLPHVVAKFVNASTPDGFNPYRITRDGIDWEVPDPEDPWSNIGYWGDHQIVYLTRLLESMQAHWPGQLASWLDAPVFSYADVPYRLKSHADMLADPRDTIVFDAARQRAIEARVAEVGADGRLVPRADGRVLHVTLAEKLLVPVLSKLGQLVLDGGIWMNTQRPEWNDANNALAGYGLSMVTLYQLYRHLGVLEALFSSAADRETELTSPVGTWLDDVAQVLRDVAPTLDGEVSDQDRRRVLDRLAGAFEAYRQRVYDAGLPSGRPRRLGELAAFCAEVRPVLAHAIHANRREDGLYHAYNLLDADPGGDAARVEHLYEMLEGQVAVLSADVLSAEEAVSVLEALFSSALFRGDQKSFLLYPDRDLPSFLDKNVVPEARAAQDSLLSALVDAGVTSVAERDANGAIRFCADFRHAGDLGAALDRLARTSPEWRDRVAAGRTETLATFEDVFHHHAFTGRSGTMFGYEGLGSIYWHMVSKLLLAVQECLLWAQRDGAPPEVQRALAEFYRKVKGGLGPAKTPQQYGAFPTDPYSHTPRHAGAQQPGMTGQVKEEIITRFRELGVTVADGTVSFGPGQLDPRDFVDGRALSFTLCGTPVRYQLADDVDGLRVEIVLDGARHERDGATLEAEEAAALFTRSDRLEAVSVTLPSATWGRVGDVE